MRLAITGHRDVHPDDMGLIETSFLEYAVGADELIFGGARGIDTICLGLACKLDARTKVVVPFTAQDQPQEARAALQSCADEVVELRLPHVKGSYLQRNDYMLRHADSLLAYWSGKPIGGTAYTVRKARGLGIPVTIVPIRDIGLPARSASPFLKSES